MTAASVLGIESTPHTAPLGHVAWAIDCPASVGGETPARITDISRQMRVRAAF
jgi:hypothetical protein